MVKLLKRQANLKVPSYTPFSLLSIRFHPSILVSYLKHGQLNLALRLLSTISSCIAFPGRVGPHRNSLKTGSSMKFTISGKNLFKYTSKLVKYWRYGSKSMKEVILYVDLLICTFCRGSNMMGYFPFPSRVGLRPRYGFSFCMVCTRGPRHSPVSWSVRLSPRARSPNIEATPRTIRPIMLLAHHCLYN